MTWRTERGVDWDAVKGPTNKRRFKRLVTSGGVAACLARVDGEPVGWCCLGPRRDFPRLERSRIPTSADADDWAVVCFYVPASQRGRGVARHLLAAAVDLARDSGARVLEGYPVRVKDGAYPATFAFVGVPRLFERCRFRDVTPPGARRLVYQRRLRPRRA